MRILYVEDNPGDADLTVQWLRKHAPQFVVETVATRRAAVARLTAPESRPYDLILTDLHLPDGDGLSLLTFIREQSLPLPVVVLTGGGNEEIAVAVLKAGADDYLAKRGDYLERLTFTLEGALNRYRAQTRSLVRPLKVLYVEHDSMDVDLTRRHLARHAPHIHLDVVTTAEALLQQLEQAGQTSPYDVLLLDYRLPGWTALEVLKGIREDRGLEIPVVLVTGQGDEEVARQALKLGAASYVIKSSGYLNQLPGELETAHYRAELLREQAALDESEARFRLMADAAPVMIWMTDSIGEATFVSQAWLDFTGQTAEQARGHGWTKCVHPEDVQRCLDESRAVRQEGRSATIEYRLRRHDSSYRWVLAQAVPRYLPDGRFVGYIGSCIDITERKQAEEVLRESEERFRHMVDTAPVMVWISGLDTRCTFFNQPWLDFTGRTLEQELGDGWAEGVHPEDFQRCLETYLTAFAAREKFRMEYRLRRADGEYRWVLDNGVPRFTPEGSFVGYIGSCIDITERKRGELQLRAQHDVSQIISESAIVSVAMPQLIQSICECFDWQCGEFWEVDGAAAGLRRSESWHQPGQDYSAFEGDCQRRTLLPGVGLPDQIWESGQPVWVTDLSSDRDFLRASSAAKVGLHSALAFPVTTGEEFFGVMVFFSHARREPEQDLLLLAHTFGNQIGQFVKHQRAVGALHESMERNRAILNAMPDLMFLYSLEGDYLDYYAADQRMLLVPPEQFIGKNVREVLPPELATEFRRCFAQTKQSGQPSRHEYSLQILGEQRHYEARIVNCNHNKILNVVRDITEQKRTEEALRQSEERFRSYFELGLIGVAITSPAKGFLEVNDYFCRTLGYERSELLQMTWAELTHPDDLAANDAQFDRALAGEIDGFAMDKRYLRKDGRAVDATISVKCQRRADRSVDYFISLIEDITERKRTEEALRESEQRYRTLFEKANDAVLLLNEQDEIIEVNQRTCELYGYARKELLAMNVTELQAPEVRGQAGSVIRSKLEQYGGTTFEALSRHRSGRRIPIEITNTPIYDQGQKLVLSIVRDITERKEMEHQRQDQITSIAETETSIHNFARIMGGSPALHEMVKNAKRVAAAEVSPILISGETGTGKGLVARAIHYASARAQHPFVVIDCTSVPETLFESQLFGHEQGAFTDAKKTQRGRLELAKGGTLFLDEISELPLALQAKLLQVIQEGTFQRLGGREHLSLNARIIAATNRDLRAEVEARRFRADLYQRLFLVRLDIPPLREREDDVPLLIEHFLAVYNRKYGKNIQRIEPQADEVLQRYPWPGNVRELDHAIERAVFFAESEQITLKHLNLDPELSIEPWREGASANREIKTASFTQIKAVGSTLDQMSSTIIKQTVEQCRGNIAKAARRLGISRSRIYRALREK